MHQQGQAEIVDSFPDRGKEGVGQTSVLDIGQHHYAAGTPANGLDAAILGAQSLDLSGRRLKSLYGTTFEGRLDSLKAGQFSLRAGIAHL